MRARKQRHVSPDPLLRACTACGAAAGKGCDTRGRNDLPLVHRASRLVHAVRLVEGDQDA